MSQPSSLPPSGGPPGLQGPPGSAPIDYNLTGLAADRGPIVIGIVSFLWALTVIAVSLRVISKYLAAGSRWWWDDYLAIIAWMFYSVKAASTIYSVTPQVGGAEHYWMTSPAQRVEFLKMQSLQFTMYPLDMGAAKCSIIAFYIKVFGIQRRFKLWCYCLLGLVVGWAISVLLVTIFMCLPVGSSSDLTAPNRTCINQDIFFNVSAILDAVLNFLILVSPLYLIWHLKLSIRKKIAISAVLMLGTGELVFTIIRIVQWANIVWRDMPWDFYPIYMWTNVQEAIAIVCICLPALGPLLRHRTKKATVQSKQSEFSTPKKMVPVGTLPDGTAEDEIPMKAAVSSYSKELDEEEEI